MSSEDESSPLDDLIPMGKQVYKILKKRGYIDKVKVWLGRKTPQDVLVLGASGVGKGSFLKAICGKQSYIHRFDRTSVSADVEGKLDNLFFRFIDTPGQAYSPFKDERQKSIIQAAGMKPLGILNIVSFGYHEGLEDANTAVSGNKPRTDYLKSRRQEELRQLPEWTDILCGKGGAAEWLITVVTKADLWWSNAPEQPSFKYYLQGQYFSELGEAKNIRHCVRSSSSHNQLFYDLVPMSGFYSDVRRTQDHHQLVATLLEYASLSA